jgi:hypothetical protein
VRSRRHGTRIFYVVENAHVRRLVEEAISHAHRRRARDLPSRLRSRWRSEPTNDH